MSSTESLEDPERDEVVITDPAVYPSFGSISPAHLFRRVLVYKGEPHQVEFFEHTKTHRDYSVVGFIAQWNMFWEAGPFRPESFYEECPPEFRWLDRVPENVEPVLVSRFDDDIYEKWSPLMHLLSARTLERFGLPVVPRGSWPRFGLRERRLPPEMEPALAQAFAHHVWPLIGRPESPLSAFSADEPIKVLTHDLSFWLPHMELLLREMNRDCGRIPRESDDTAPEVSEVNDVLELARPTYGVNLWDGEEAAWEITQMLVERADVHGNLRGIVDAVRSNRVADDFSARWSYEREDFERKLYSKRAKVKVSFVELPDAIPFHGTGADIEGEMIWRDLMAIVDPKDRRVVVCLSRGMTRVGEIAKELGYANHSPISKALARIQQQAKGLLGD